MSAIEQNNQMLIDIPCPDDPQPAETIIAEDGNIYDADTGEQVGIIGAPELTDELNDGTKRDIATWVGERRDYHLSKIAGLTAEYEDRQKRLAEAYEPQIRRHENALTWVETRYKGLIFEIAVALSESIRRKTVQIGLCVVKLSKTRAKTTVIDELKAWDWCFKHKLFAPMQVSLKAEGEEALNLITEAEEKGYEITSKLLVSKIPDELKPTLTPEESGIEYDAGGIKEMKYV